MIDIETLATTPDAIVMCIAAVKFSFDNDQTEVFYRNIDISSSKSFGLVSDKKTIEWWKTQPENILKSFMIDTKPLDTVLTELNQFSSSQDDIWWSMGTSFDFPILESSYRATGIPIPWKYWNQRDVRTLVKICRVRNDSGFGKHDPVHDCMHQIDLVKYCLVE